MALTGTDLKIFKKWLTGHLRHGPTTITFTKKNGDERIMNCTLSPTHIMFKDPTYLEDIASLTNSEENTIITVYDIENVGWRSIRWESIKTVRFKLK